MTLLDNLRADVAYVDGQIDFTVTRGGSSVGNVTGYHGSILKDYQPDTFGLIVSQQTKIVIPTSASGYSPAVGDVLTEVDTSWKWTVKTITLGEMRASWALGVDQPSTDEVGYTDTVTWYNVIVSKDAVGGIDRMLRSGGTVNGKLIEGDKETEYSGRRRRTIPRYQLLLQSTPAWPAGTEEFWFKVGSYFYVGSAMQQAEPGNPSKWDVVQQDSPSPQVLP